MSFVLLERKFILILVTFDQNTNNTIIVCLEFSVARYALLLDSLVPISPASGLPNLAKLYSPPHPPS